MTLQLLCVAAILLPIQGARAQSSARPTGPRFDVGVGAARLAERFCAGCSAGPRTVGPALLLRASRGWGRVFEAGVELQATVGGGRHFEALLGTVALMAPVEYAAWLRIGAGILLQPGQADDVTVSGGGLAQQNGGELAAGLVVGFGMDVPLRGRRSLVPQVSYIRHLGREGRFDLLLVGLALRFY